MTDVGTLTLSDFLLARIAEDEIAARAASRGTVVGKPHDWRPAPGGDEWEPSPAVVNPETEVLVALRPALPRPPEVMGGLWGQVAVWQDEDGYYIPIADHIARHDPARVLAEVDVKQQIVAEHAPFEDSYAKPGTWCRMCASPTGWPFSTVDGGVPYPCPTLRLVALPYADHPDYRSAWAV